MTTFDYSIRKAPPGRHWYKSISNESGPDAVINDLGPYGIGTWSRMRPFSQWLENQGLRSYQPDWCLHVAKGTRKQILAFADVCLEMGFSGPAEHAALVRAIEVSNEKYLVIEVAEF